MLAVLVLALAACGTSAPERLAPVAQTPDLTPVTVKVGHQASTQWAPLYLAIERGYFQRLNVDVQLQTLRLGQDPIALVGRGQLDAVVTDFDVAMFNQLAGGMRFKVAGSMAAIPAEGPPPLVLEVAKPLIDSGQVKTIADLRGRKIAVDGGTGSGAGYMADQVLKKAGIRLKDLTVIDLASASMEPAVSVHSIDVALAPAPFATTMEQHGLMAPIGAPPPGDTWSGVLYAEKLGGSPGQRFFEGLVRGARDMRGPARTSDDTLPILAKYTGLTVDVLRKMPPYDWDGSLRPDAAALAGLQASYREAGLLKYDVDLAPSRLVDTAYSKRAATAVH